VPTSYAEMTTHTPRPARDAHYSEDGHSTVLLDGGSIRSSRNPDNTGGRQQPKPAPGSVARRTRVLSAAGPDHAAISYITHVNSVSRHAAHSGTARRHEVDGMVCAFTTRLARTARGVATATAWAILGTSAIQAAPPARTVPCPLLNPLPATDRSLKLVTEDRLAYTPCAVDVAPVQAEAWDGAIRIAVPSNDHPDSAWGPALPPLTSDREECGDPLTTDVVWRPDMPVVAFLLTGLAVAFLRRRSAFALD